MLMDHKFILPVTLDILIIVFTVYIFCVYGSRIKNVSNYEDSGKEDALKISDIENTEPAKRIEDLVNPED